MDLLIMENGKIIVGVVGEFIKTKRRDINTLEIGNRIENGGMEDKVQSDGFIKEIILLIKNKGLVY